MGSTTEQSVRSLGQSPSLPSSAAAGGQCCSTGRTTTAVLIPGLAAEQGMFTRRCPMQMGSNTCCSLLHKATVIIWEETVMGAERLENTSEVQESKKAPLKAKGT